MLHWLRGGDIDDAFPDEAVMMISHTFIAWYTEFLNFIVCELLPGGLTSYQNKKFLCDVKKVCVDEPYSFREYADHVIRMCVTELEMHAILEACHTLSVVVHHGGIRRAIKVLQCGYYWPTMYCDAHVFCKFCEQRQM